MRLLLNKTALLLLVSPYPTTMSMSTTSSSNRGSSNNRRSARIKAGLDSSIITTPTKEQNKKSNSSVVYDNMPPLLTLGRLIRGTLIKRPSATIRSPYVADVKIQGKKDTVLAHAPALDVGGLCFPGSDVYVLERPPGGKTSHSIELVCGDPIDEEDTGVLVGAKPHLGEVIAEEVLKRGLITQDVLSLKDGFALGPVNDFTKKSISPKKGSPKKQSPAKKKLKTNEDDMDTKLSATETMINLQQQVTIGDSRVDFQMTLTKPGGQSHKVVFEVKNVVCADYQASNAPVPKSPGHCVVVAPEGKKDEEYKRAALFPWGKTRGQKFDNKPVVSERACKHLKNLESMLDEKNVTPVVLFIVNRADCQSMRPCHEKDPVFAEILSDVVKAGVKALAVRVRWTEDGECFYDGMLPVNV